MKYIQPVKIPKIKALGLNNLEGVENPLQKSLIVKYISCEQKGIILHLKLDVEAKGINPREAKAYINVFRGDITQNNLTNESVMSILQINPNGRKNVEVVVPVSFASNEYYKTNKYYRASVNVDGIFALSEGFEIKIVKRNSSTNNKKLTAEDLARMGVPIKIAQDYVNDLNTTFEEYKINTSLRKISFFGQVLSETEAFRIKSEQNVSDSSYGGFKGRGCMQLTGKSNYVGYEEYKKKNNPNIDFTSNTANKDKVNELPYYLDSGGWFWTIRTELNDDADRNDLIYIAYRVNGGFNHFDKRVDYYNKAAEVIDKNFVNSTFDLRISSCYNIQKACFAWGLWHDPHFPSNKFKGVIRDSNIAKQAYLRFLELYTKAGNPKLPSDGWYGIKDIVSFANQRLKSL